MIEFNWKKILKVVIPLLVAVLSITVLAKYAASPEFHAGTIEALDEKKSTVMELTAASTAASVAITALPGDVATPLAEKLVDLSSAFLIVLSAIYLEKYLVTITGYAASVVLIPAACILFSLNAVKENERLKYMAKKLAIFGIAIVLVIPASVKVSDMIEATYETSINETIEAAKGTTEEIEEATEEKEGIISGIISKVEESVNVATDKIENTLNNFIEALAVMIVTSCVIPVVVLFFFVWIVRIVLGVDVNIPMKSFYKKG